MSLQRGLIQTLESLQRAGLDQLPRCETAPWKLPEPVIAGAQKVTVKLPPQTPPQQRSGSVAPETVSQPAASASPPAPSVQPSSSPSRSEKPAARLPERPAVSAPLFSAPPAPVLNDFSAQRVQSEASFMKKVPLQKRSERESCLTALAGKVAGCTRCPELARTRTQTVFGVGNPEAKVMFVGEAPGADEDKQGEPFVGRAGQLLNKIIGACGWTREELYICNILRCRPPGNRNPTPIEAGNCREYLDGQIETVNPEYIVCWGTIAAQNLLGNNTPIGRLRGQLFAYGRAKVLCTYHPSYLLRNPSAKKFVWEDLKILLQEMGIDPEKITPRQ